jgi:hypothetical protein
MTKETFICKGCGHDLPNDFSIRTEDYCYMCDPNVTVEELLKDYDDKVTEIKAARERLGADKLGLKHLSQYLPYGLKLFYGENDIRELIYLDTNSPHGSFKPILRPMSDYFDITSKAMKELNLDISDQIWLANLGLGMYLLADLPYRLACRLAEEHIDFMDLIPAGLAVSFKEVGL